MHSPEKRAYSTPEFVEFGRIEEITSTKSWHAANDWLGEILELFLPSGNGNIIGGGGANSSQFS